MDIPLELIAAKNDAQLALMALPGVVGVSIGMREANGELFDELAIRVLITDASAVPAGIPDTIGGVGVSIVEAHIELCALPQPDTSRYPQIAGGIQITSPSIGSGTLGCIVQDANTGELFGLSCYHVVGNPNNTFPNTIWQPTNPPLIVGIPTNDNLGGVARVDFPHTPPLPGSPLLLGLTDAAVISLTNAMNQGRALSPAVVGQDIQQLNLVDRITASDWSQIGQKVRKRGAVTRVTSGFVLGVQLSAQWTAGPANTWLMEQCEIQGSSSSPDKIFLQKGDSGSLVLDQDSPTALGLVWGQYAGGVRGIMCAIRNVESQLGVNTSWS
jgi:hypothetical protein